MGVVGWSWLMVGASFALYAGIAVWSRLRSTAELYVAERPVHPVLNGMATAADWISAASFMSMAGILAFGGRDGAAYLLGWTGGYVLLAVLLAPYLRKYGKFTVPQFVGDRYYSGAARSVAVICALVVSFTYVAGQVRGVGIVLARLLEVPIERGVLVGVAVVFAYAILGGMKGITPVQVAQYAVLLAAFLVPAVLLSARLTGNPVPPLALLGGLDASGAAALGASPGAPLVSVLDRLSADLGLPAYTAGVRPRADVLATAAALMIGTAGLPHILIRFFTARKIREARSSAAWALLFVSALYLTAPALAALARATWLHQLAARPGSVPASVAAWERAGLAGVAAPGPGAPPGAPAGLARLDPDALVVATPELAGLPPWVSGLVAAGALAAALSTAAGLLLVIAAGFSHDLLRTVAPRMSDRAELWWARLAAAGAALLAGWFGLHPPGLVAETVAIAFGLAAASLFPALVLGVFWRRATREGAVAGMLAGLVATLAYATWFKGLHPERDVPAGWWLGISPQGFGAVGALLALAVAVGVSLATAAPPREVQDRVEALRRPRRTEAEAAAPRAGALR